MAVQHACPLAAPVTESDREAGFHAPPETSLGMSDLVGPAGKATLRSKRLAGKRISVAGYLLATTATLGRRIEITERSSAPCQMCGGWHDPGPAIQVYPAARSTWTPWTEDRFAVHSPFLVDATLTLVANASADAVSLTDAVLYPVTARSSVRSSPRPGFRSPTTRGDRGIRAGTGTRCVPRKTDVADIVVQGGPIHTVCEALGTVSAVAIRDGHFLAVGSLDDMDRHRGPETRVLDLQGKTAVPGLIDSHLHQIMLAINLPAVDLFGAGTIADVQARLAQRAASTPVGEWIVASSGWHESILDEGRLPTRWELDEATGAHPVMVPRGGHVVTANSLALQAAGIDDATPDPPGGVIVRDKDTGEATGVLLETAATLVRRVAPAPPPPEVLEDRLADAMALLNSYGIVAVVDPSVDARISEVYKRLHANGRVTVRSDLLYKVRDLAETEQALGYVGAQRSDARLRFPGIKFMLDGGVEGARMSEPYRIVPGEQPHADYRGLLLTPPGGREEFIAALRLAAEAGVQVQTHGVGDEAIDFIADCYAQIAADHDIGELGWCLMHVFLPSDAALRKLKAAGVRLTVQDHPVLLGHNQRRWWGDERAAAAIPIRRLLDAGLPVGGGTDGPVVPVDPFLSMWWMVTRQTLKGYALGPEHAIAASEALALYTLRNAEILGVDADRGSIEPGKRADLAVLSQDILAVAPAAIRDTRALLTMLDGEVVYRAPDAAEL